MKFLLSILVVCTLNASAANYYFSDLSGNDGTGDGSISTPWKSLAKFQTLIPSLVEGDFVYFKAGETYFGQVNMGQVFQSAHWTLTRYGTGADPVFSCMATLTGWTSVGTNLYEATVPGIGDSKVQCVTVDGFLKPMGRFPNVSDGNGGYLSYDSIAPPYLGSIYDAQLSNSPSWVGAEVVVRKNHWIIDRATITSQVNGTITFTDPSGQTGNRGYGYFIQDDPRTLDQQHEWYYNPSTKKIRYYSTANPSAYTIKAAIYDTLFYAWGKFGMEIKNIVFEGSNKSSVYTDVCADVKFTNNTIRYAGLNGWQGTTMPNLQFKFNTIEEIGNNGAYTVFSDNVIYEGNTVRNIAVYPGMGKSNNQARMGLYLGGTGGQMIRNKLRNIGYIPVYFHGSYVTVRYNDIDSFCVTADDGGGVYASGGGTDTARVVEFNTISNGFGNKYGTNQDDNNSASGVYMDDRSANVAIRYNTIYNTSENGVYVHNSKNIDIDGNTILKAKKFGVTCSFDRLENNTWRIRNVKIKRNKIFQPSTAGFNYPVDDIGGMLRLYSDSADINDFGLIDSNYYYSPSAVFYTSENYGIVNTTLQTFSQWKTSHASYDPVTPLTVVTAPADSITIFANRDSVLAVKVLPRIAKDLRNITRDATIAAPAYGCEILTYTGDLPARIVTPIRLNIKFK